MLSIESIYRVQTRWADGYYAQAVSSDVPVT